MTLSLRLVALCRRSQYTGALSLCSRTHSALSCGGKAKFLRQEDQVASVVSFPNGLHLVELSSSAEQKPSRGVPKKEEEDETKLSLYKRFMKDLSQYWYLMLPVHIVTSYSYFLVFYYASKAGFNPAPLMDMIGVPAQYVDPIRDSTASHVAVGYAGYKVIAPVRYLTTIVVTRMAVRTLSSRGLLKPMPTFSEFKTSVKTKFKSVFGK